MFNHSKVAVLTKWIAAIFLIGTDKGYASLLRLLKLIRLQQCRIARSILKKLLTAMADRDSRCPLDGLIELDDAYVEDRHPEKRGRRTKRCNLVLFAVQKNGNAAGFMHAHMVGRVDFRSVEEFYSHQGANAVVLSNALTESQVISKSHAHHTKVTPPEQASSWLLKLHVVISNLKTFLLGSFSWCITPVHAGICRRVRLPVQPSVMGAADPMRLLQTAVVTRPLNAVLD